jgi:hypothetical protein
MTDPLHIDCAMISQPMAGLSEKEILRERRKAVKFLQQQGYEVLNTYFAEPFIPRSCLIHQGLYLLAKSLDVMAHCQAVYFCEGWEHARGCRIEHEAAQNYGLTIIYEE